MTREETIDLIDNRIKSEYKKHGDLDWSRIAARKIYSSLEGVLDVGKEREDSVMMSLYGLIEQQKQTISVDVKTFTDGKIELLFHSDCGKFGTDEILDGYKLTAERLLNILQERDDYSEDEL